MSTPRNNQLVFGQALTPTQVYCAAIGAFEEDGYTLEHVIAEQNAENETARVYEKNGKLFILHYPGKDNDEKPTEDKTTASLRDIINKTEDALRELQEKRLYEKKQLQDAHKIFIIAESNTYVVGNVAHYVTARLDGLALTIEDSIKRAYDDSYIKDVIYHRTSKELKHDWQSQYTDDWQCGHYVIAAIHRDLRGVPAPTGAFKITQNEIDEHNRLFATGVTSYTQKKEERIESYKPFDAKEDEIDALLDADSPSSLPIIKKPGFFERNPWVKNALIGAGIGLVALGVIVGTVASFGAFAPALGVSMAGLAAVTGGSILATAGIGAGIVAGLAAIGAGTIAGFTATRYVAKKAIHAIKGWFQPAPVNNIIETANTASTLEEPTKSQEGNDPSFTDAIFVSTANTVTTTLTKNSASNVLLQNDSSTTSHSDEDDSSLTQEKDQGKPNQYPTTNNTTTNRPSFKKT